MDVEKGKRKEMEEWKRILYVLYVYILIYIYGEIERQSGLLNI